MASTTSTSPTPLIPAMASSSTTPTPIIPRQNQDTNTSYPKKPYVVMVLVQIIAASMSLLSKEAITKGMSPYVFVVYRQALATIALAPFAIFMERGSDSPKLTLAILGKIVLTSVGNTLSLNLFHLALKYVSATFATALVNTIPAITFILAVCFRIENLSLTQTHGVAKIIGSTLGLAGALLCTFVRGPTVYSSKIQFLGHIKLQDDSEGQWIKGSLIILAGNVAWCFWFMMQGPLMRQYQAKIRLTTLQCLSSCALSAVWATAKERHVESWKVSGNISLISVIYCGVIATAINYWLLVWVVQKKGPVFSSAFNPLALVITAVFSVVIYGETLYWGSISGAILLLVGLYGILWGKNVEAKVKAAIEVQ